MFIIAFNEDDLINASSKDLKTYDLFFKYLSNGAKHKITELRKNKSKSKRNKFL